MLVFGYDVLNYNLSETFREVTWKYKIDKFINKLCNTLNELINKGYSGTTNLLSEFLETLKTIEDCISCKDNMGKLNLDKFHERISEIENCLAKLEKEEQEEWKKKNVICELNDELFRADNESIKSIKEILCKVCKGKKIEKLTDKYGNKEIARFLHECKLNAKYYYEEYNQWIPFHGFRDIEYLAKGGFGEVHKATWFNGYYNKYEEEYEGREVVLKRIYNSSDKSVDTLNEVK